MNIIECSNICKSFGSVKVLDQINLKIPKGEIFGLLGPNGAGKTTLIRIINQITIPDSGEVLFNGEPLKPKDVYKMGYLPEERGLYKKMKVGEQAVYLARLKGMAKEQAIGELKKWFVKFGIQNWWDKKIEELSKGMAQKIQFITTVMHKPQLLILDEPFSGFDPVNVDLIRTEVKRLKEEGCTIILSTHNMGSVEELCDSIALVNKSKIIVSGKLHDIKNAYGDNKVEIVYSGELPSIGVSSYTVLEDNPYFNDRKAILKIEKGVSSKDILKEIYDKIEIISYNNMLPTMDEIFIKLVTNKE